MIHNRWVADHKLTRCTDASWNSQLKGGAPFICIIGKLGRVRSIYLLACFWCFFWPRFCTVRLYWAGATFANEVNFVMNHAPGDKLISTIYFVASFLNVDYLSSQPCLSYHDLVSPALIGQSADQHFWMSLGKVDLPLYALDPHAYSLTIIELNMHDT